MHIYICIYIFVCVSVCVSVCLCVCFCQSNCLSVSVCLCLCVCVCNLVARAAAAKLAAGVQDRQHRLERRLARLGVQVARNAAPVVGDRQPAVGVHRHVDLRRPAGQRLVDGVVHHFESEVVQPARPSRANVHPRALTHRLEPFENGDLIGPIVRRHRRWRAGSGGAGARRAGARAARAHRCAAGAL